MRPHKMPGVIRASAFVLAGACSLLAQTPNPPSGSDAKQLFQQGVAAQQRGDDATAIANYRQLLKLHPEAAPVRVNLGATLAHRKRFDEAIAQYLLVLTADPANRGARLNLALAYQEKGDLPRAVRELETLHASQPANEQTSAQTSVQTSVQTSMLLGDCYVRLKRYAKAIAILKPLESATPDADNLDLMWMLGSAFINAGHPQEGVERIEKVAQKADNADAYLLAGETRLDLAQYDLAKQDAEAALRLNPKLAGVQTLNGMVLEHTGDYDDAEAALQKAIQSDANDFNAQFYLGSIFYFKRDMDGARLHLSRALELRPESPQARYKLALVERSDQQLDAAVKDLQRVLRQSPNWVEPHAELATLYYRLKRPEDGAREKSIVDRLVSQQPSHSRATP